MSLPRSSVVLLVPLALLFAQPASAATEGPAGRVQATAETTLVEVPVHVISKDGQPVRGLRKEDFELFDDGKPAEITEMEVVDLDEFAAERPPESPSPNAPPAPARILPPQARRHFFLLFDLSFSEPIKVARARGAAREFVSKLNPGDSVGVATLDVERGMKLVLSFSSDRAQIDGALETLALPGLLNATADPFALVLDTALLEETVRQGGKDAIWARILLEMKSVAEKPIDMYQAGRVNGLLGSFGDIARTLNSVRGRKQIVFFSEGVDSKLITGTVGANAGTGAATNVINNETWKVDNDARFGTSALQNNLQDMLKLFNRSDCVLYSFDISGLTETNSDVRNQVAVGASTGGNTASDLQGNRGRGSDSLTMFAHETGGEVFRNSNDIPGQLARLQKQTSLVYLLVFSPKKVSEPGAFHTLKVKVKAPGAHLSARSGYYEPKPWAKLTPNEKKLASADLIAYGLPRFDVPASVVTGSFQIEGTTKWETPVIVEIPGEKLLLGQVGDRANIEVYGYALDRSLHVADYFAQNFSLDLTKLRCALSQGGIKYYGTLFVPPGSYSLKVLVRNAATGRTGLQIHPLTVPAGDSRAPFLLPPFLAEAPGRWVMVKGTAHPNQQASAGYPFTIGGESFTPSASPVLANGSEARLCVMAYNLSGKEEMKLTGRVIGRDGREVGKAVLERATHDENGPGALTKTVVTFKPEGLVASTYTLAVSVKNSENGLTSESTLPFEVK